MSTSTPSTMRQWQYSVASPTLPAALKLSTTTPIPAPPTTPSQVQIHVHAAAVNPIDYKIAELPLIGRLFPTKPASPGLDFAGTIHAPSSSTPLPPGYKHGDRVLGRLGGPTQHGALSEYVIAPASSIAHLPAKLSFVDGAAIGTAGMTALQSLEGVGAGSKVFVNGASGGVGCFTVQIGRILGASVTASCSGANAGLVKELGAQEVVDYRSKDVASELSGEGHRAKYDLIVDNVGKPAGLHKAGDVCLGEKGRVVQVGGGVDFGSALAMMKSALLPAALGGAKKPWKFLAVKDDGKQLGQLATWAEEGKLKIMVDTVYPYEEAPKAYEKLKTGRARGKIVVSSSNK